jgi:hypothetical protein
VSPEDPTQAKHRASLPLGSVDGREPGCKRAVVIPLERTRFLIWATPRGDRLAYEVSKAVDGPLQARCATAPLCPGEDLERTGAVPGWIDPQAAPIGECPYQFETRGECIRSRNVQALEAALFHSREANLVANYLSALGYTVKLEEIPQNRVLDGTRILHAHSKIGDTHDVRVLAAPGGGELVLVRDLGSGQRVSDLRRPPVPRARPPRSSWARGAPGARGSRPSP